MALVDPSLFRYCYKTYVFRNKEIELKLQKYLKFLFYIKPNFILSELIQRIQISFELHN